MPVRIKKRGATSVAPKHERERIVPQCHYTIFRHPIRDAGKGTFHSGPEQSGILAVYNGSCGASDTASPEKLYNDIVDAGHWFISRNPGKYSVVATVFGVSFTFLVMQDGTYKKGWLDLPEFLKKERECGRSHL